MVRLNGSTNQVVSIGNQMAADEQHIHQLLAATGCAGAIRSGPPSIPPRGYSIRASVVDRLNSIDQALTSLRETAVFRGGRISPVAEEFLDNRLNQIDQNLAAMRQTHASLEQRLTQSLATEVKDVRQRAHATNTHLLQQARLKMLLAEIRKHYRAEIGGKPRGQSALAERLWTTSTIHYWSSTPGHFGAHSRKSKAGLPSMSPMLRRLLRLLRQHRLSTSVVGVGSGWS